MGRSPACGPTAPFITVPRMATPPSRPATPQPRGAETLWAYISQYDGCAEALAAAACEAYRHRRSRAARRAVVAAFATHARQLKAHDLSESEIRVVLLALYHVGAERRDFGVDAAGVDDLVLDLIASAVDGLGEPEAPSAGGETT